MKLLLAAGADKDAKFKVSIEAPAVSVNMPSRYQLHRRPYAPHFFRSRRTVLRRCTSLHKRGTRRS